MWHNKCVLACLLNISVGIMLLGIENDLFSASFIFNKALMGKLLALTLSTCASRKGARQKCHQEPTEDIGKQLKDRAECWRGSFISVTMRISV